MGTISGISDTFIDAFAALDPVEGVREMGVGLDADTMTDYSPDGDAAMADLYRRTREALAAAPPEDESERLGAAYLDDLCATRLALIETGEHSCLLSELGGPQAAVRQLFDLLDHGSPEAWERIGVRLAKVPAAIDSYRQSLAAGLAAGHRSTVRQAEAVADQCATWAGNGDGGWFGEYVADAADPALDDLARDAAAAYGELATWLRQSYAPSASTADGVGAERYRVWAVAMLGADLDPDESYQWGCVELARLEADKVVECDRILPGADFAAVCDLLLTDPARAVHGVDAYRTWLQDLVDEATEGLSGTQFDIPDALRRCDVGIPPVGTAAAPYYTPPSEDLSLPGRVWFPTLGEVSFPMWADVTTAYHEAVPGHHLQFGCSYMAALTRAQRLGFQAAHGEGWALYAERLMDELGWFRTPDTRLGFLSSQAFRAAASSSTSGCTLGGQCPTVCRAAASRGASTRPSPPYAPPEGWPRRPRAARCCGTCRGRRRRRPTSWASGPGWRVGRRRGPRLGRPSTCAPGTPARWRSDRSVSTAWSRSSPRSESPRRFSSKPAASARPTRAQDGQAVASLSRM